MTTTTAAGSRSAAVRAGLFRGWIETRQNFTEAAHVVGQAIPPVAYVAVLLFMSRFARKTIHGTDVALVTMALPSLLGFTIATGGLSTPAMSITADREDGTLLRAKATPHGMLGYLVGKIVMFASTTLFGMLAIAIPGVMIVDNLRLDARAWLLLALLFVVGMVATVPMGLALGSVMKSSLQAMLVPLGWTLLMAISGIFQSITVLPTWLQWAAQAFPVYWLGLGVRSAMLPSKMVVAEIGQSWRTVEMFAVLGAWAVGGLLLAPILLRRMARRQSGSAVAQVRERYLAKGY
jgi:ABC-2 type transport system permease protein